MDQKNMEEKAATTQWPPFSMLVAYLVPEWMGKAVDQIAQSFPGRIRSVWFSIDASYYYDDNDNYDLRGYAGIGTLPEQKISEEELDQVPGMRCIERRAKELWDLIPVDINEEGGIDGELDFGFGPDGFSFEFNTLDYCGECLYKAEAKYESGTWKYCEQICFYSEQASETALAIGDAKAILAGINSSEFKLDQWPNNDDMIIAQDEEGMFTLTVPGGGLFKHFERTVG